jgi:hypothetical protein
MASPNAFNILSGTPVLSKGIVSLGYVLKSSPSGVIIKNICPEHFVLGQYLCPMYIV